MQDKKLGDLQLFHKRALKKGCKGVAKRINLVSPDLYRVEGGKDLTQLRECFGFYGDGNDLYLWSEELEYAKAKGILSKIEDSNIHGFKREREDDSSRIEIKAFYAD